MLKKLSSCSIFRAKRRLLFFFASFKQNVRIQIVYFCHERNGFRSHFERRAIVFTLAISVQKIDRKREIKVHEFRLLPLVHRERNQIGDVDFRPENKISWTSFFSICERDNLSKFHHVFLNFSSFPSTFLHNFNILTNLENFQKLRKNFERVWQKMVS